MVASSKVLLLILYTALLLLSCLILSSNASTSTDDEVQLKITVGVRRLLLKAELADEDEDEEERPIHPPKKTKPTTATTSTTSQSKMLSKSSTTLNQSPTPKPMVKKLNSTATSSSKQSLTSSKNSTTLISTKSKKLSNTTSKATDSTKKSPDLISSNLPKNKTTKAKINNLSQPNSTSTPKIKKITTAEVTNSKSQENPNPKLSKPKQKQQPLPSWIDQDEEEDLVDEFRNLPSKFQKTLLPDLESISQTSKAYLTEANKEMTKNFKPLIGKKYASTTANIVSFTFIILPLILVSLLITRIKTYFSLQKLLIFINIYLSIYFTILSLSALVTGIEPLRFLFATAQSTYVGIQILQTLCYVMYLLLLVMYLVLVFSTAAGPGSKILGLGQTFVGFAVGLHYYVAVFHRVVMHQPPKTNWKVHGVYATCFLVICLFASAERRKKEYLADGGEEGKKS